MTYVSVEWEYYQICRNSQPTTITLPNAEKSFLLGASARKTTLHADVSTEFFSHHQGESEELWTKLMRIFIHALLRWYSAKIFSELKLVTDNLPLHSHRSHWEATEISRIQDMKQGMIKNFENFVTKFGDVASFGGTSNRESFLLIGPLRGCKNDQQLSLTKLSAAWQDLLLKGCTIA